MQQGGLTNAAALKGGFDAWRVAGLGTESGIPDQKP
jgi:rhodanese-related sulfurtransferase